MEEQIECVGARHMPHLVPCADPPALVGACDRSAIDLVLKNGAGPGQATVLPATWSLRLCRRSATSEDSVVPKKRH
jgi:hypothetical protein